MRERLKNNPRHGVVVSRDPDSTAKGRWLVQFDGEEGETVKTSRQLVRITASSPRSSDSEDDIAYLPGTSTVKQSTSTREEGNDSLQEDETEEDTQNNNTSHNSDDDDSPSFVERMINKVQENPSQSVSFSVVMTVAGAILGPFLDSYHSAFGALEYKFRVVVCHK